MAPMPNVLSELQARAIQATAEAIQDLKQPHFLTILSPSFLHAWAGSLHIKNDELGLEGWSNACLTVIVGKKGADEETLQKSTEAKSLMNQAAEAEKKKEEALEQGIEEVKKEISKVRQTIEAGRII